jgi:L-lysine exporter family protein LysE/ArgO
MSIVLAGFATSFALIVAIGAQNAYVLRVGLARTYVAMVVLVCLSSDAILIFAGTAGLGGLIASHEGLLRVVAWVGAAYLATSAVLAFRRATKSGVLLPSEGNAPSRRSVLARVLGFTWLNPHVYLDTVLLLGSISSQYGASRWWFALGASLASVTWFSALGFGSKALAKLMSRPVTWRILDVFIGLIMASIAASLVRMALR